MKMLSSLLLLGSFVVPTPYVSATPPQLTLTEPVTREVPVGRGITIGFELDVDGAPPQGEVVVSGGGAQCVATLPDTHCVLTPSLPGPLQVTAEYSGDGVHPPLASMPMDYTVLPADMYPYLASVGGGFVPAIERVQTGGAVLSGDFSQAILSYNTYPTPSQPLTRPLLLADLSTGSRRDFIGVDHDRFIIGSQDFSTDGRFIAFTDVLEINGEAIVRLVLLDRMSDEFVVAFETVEAVVAGYPAAVPGRPTVSDNGRYVAFIWSGQVYVFDAESGSVSLASVDSTGLPFSGRLYTMSRSTGDLIVADESTLYRFSVATTTPTTWFEAPEPIWDGRDIFVSLANQNRPLHQTVPLAANDDLMHFAYVPRDARDFVVLVDRNTGQSARWQIEPSLCRNITLGMSADGGRLQSNGVSCGEPYSYSWLADDRAIGPDLGGGDRQCYAQLSRDGQSIARQCFESSGLQLAKSDGREFQPAYAGWVGNQSNEQSRNLGITGTGRHVWFRSDANNLTPQPESRRTFIHNMVEGETRVVHDGVHGVANSGRWAVLETDGVSACARVDASLTVVELYRVDTGRRSCVNRSRDGSAVAGRSFMPAIASAGRYVVYLSEVSNLVEDDLNDQLDVFVFDRLTGITRLVSVGPVDANPVDGRVRPAISYNGRYILFAREADRVAIGGEPSKLYIRDTRNGDLSEIPTDGSGYYSGQFRGLHVSSNGRYVGYQVHLNVADIRPEPFDAMQYNRHTGQTQQVMGLVNTFKVSSNGRYAVVEKAPFDNADCGLDEPRRCQSFALDIRRGTQLQLPSSWHNPAISGNGELISYSHRGEALPYDATLSDDVVVDVNPLFEIR